MRFVFGSEGGGMASLVMSVSMYALGTKQYVPVAGLAQYI